MEFNIVRVERVMEKVCLEPAKIFTGENINCGMLVPLPFPFPVPVTEAIRVHLEESYVSSQYEPRLVCTCTVNFSEGSADVWKLIVFTIRSLTATTSNMFPHELLWIVVSNNVDKVKFTLKYPYC